MKRPSSKVKSPTNGENDHRVLILYILILHDLKMEVKTAFPSSVAQYDLWANWLCHSAMELLMREVLIAGMVAYWLASLRGSCLLTPIEIRDQF